jgi:hypothetical protein
MFQGNRERAGDLAGGDFTEHASENTLCATDVLDE